MESEERPCGNEPLVFSDKSLQACGNDSHGDTSTNVIPNKVTVEPEKSVNMNNKEAPDDLYYRPKKMQKAYQSKMTVDHSIEKKVKDQAEDRKEQARGTMEESNTLYRGDASVKCSPPESNTTSLSDMDTAESERSRIKCDQSEPKIDVLWKPHEGMRKDCQPKDPQDNESCGELRKQKYHSVAQKVEGVTRVGEESLPEQFTHSAEGLKEISTENVEGIAKNSLPGKEDNVKEEISKKEKEKRKKSRREKRKHNSGPGSRCSVLQEAQSRREAEHEEGRERRLAQEIKGFNWLEEKIKNSSLLSSQSAPSTPTTSPSSKELEQTSRTFSTPSTAHSTQSTCDNKGEEHSKKNRLSGNSNGIGFKRHLQTAVPPLVHSSKVTALPKRHQSLGTPTTPPSCSSSSALSSYTAAPSMTVPGALYTHEPTNNKAEHGRVEPVVEKSSIFEHKSSESDKATLYSSNSSTKATLYGVKDNGFQALYDTVSANAVNYYGSADSANIDTKNNINTSPPINFYGSAKYQKSDTPPDKVSFTGSHTNSSVSSTSQDSPATTNHRPNKFHSFKFDTCPSKNTEWFPGQALSQNSNSQHSGYSVDSSCPQRFSHKQALLRRAFQEMVKSDTNNPSTQETKDKQCVLQNYPPKTEMNKSDEIKCKKAETSPFTVSHSSSEATSPVDVIKLKHQCPSSTSPKPVISSESSLETTILSGIPHSLKSVTNSPKQEKDMNGPVCTTSEISVLPRDRSQDAESVTCEPNSDKSVMPETIPNTEEKYIDIETPIQVVKEDKKEPSLQTLNDNEHVNVTKTTANLESNVIDCIASPSADIDMKTIKDDICNNTDGKNKDDTEVQPNLLLSVLYKELMKTRQEVEKLRKVQELMLTEKEEKKEDITEQNNESMTECERVKNLPNDEVNLKKRKDNEIIDDTESINDNDDCHYLGSKRSKISIRSDLLPMENSIAMDTTPDYVSPIMTSNPQQSTSPALTNPSPVQSSSEICITTLDDSVIPDTSHSSRSPAIPPLSPRLSSSILLPQNMTSSLPTNHTSTSPGVSNTRTVITESSPTVIRESPEILKSNREIIIVSPGTSFSPSMPASSPGMLRTSPITPNSPGLPRTSPGMPRSSPGLTKITPGLPMTSPGLPRTSPGMPRTSPGLPRTSPGMPRTSPGLPRTSPGMPRTSPGMVSSSPGVVAFSPGSSIKDSGIMDNGLEVSIVNCEINQSSPPGKVFNPHTKPSSTENPNLSPSPSAVTTIHSKMTSPQSIISPVIPVSRYHQSPITSTTVPVISPNEGRTNCSVSRISPNISKIDTVVTLPVSKTGTTLTNVHPNKLRSAFGISNSEVELMPVSVAGKQPLHEPQPQTFLNRIEAQHHHLNENPILHGVFQESGSKTIESSSNNGPVPFHNFGCHDDPKRMNKIHHYMGEMKRHAFSTSDLPDHPSSTCKQPPPLKPVSALLRRHSDNMDIHSVMHHQAMYPSTSKNRAGSLHSGILLTEHKTGNTVHPFNQPQYTPAQYPFPNPRIRRGSESNPSERTRGYHQGVSMGMQHHLPPGSSGMRNLGPDKATIFPVSPVIPTGIRPFRPTTPPSVPKGPLEQMQSDNFYRTNYTFFEKLREKFAHSMDTGMNVMDRPQPSAANIEKPLQPQTFAPRVIVRESMPEVPSHMPTPFSTLHFPNQNQAPPNALASHQNPFSINIHSNPSIQHMTQPRLHSGTNPATPNIHHNGSNGRGPEKVCFHCPQPARFICSGCKKAWYCSEHCQREHWNIHNATCIL